ncbi:thioredoxin-related transmembrane protein 1 [Danio aesculapii]|uniref:thioredoxin-related transmembrane protein 1 n=1 Tax=Danio aesculapii TaxID=1142201 RepID=UPI0024BF82A5|nr:thioredoxin-related transmembrane protein 1 [Danio aesculapii]
MACGDPRRVRQMTAGACVLSMLAACVIAQPAAAKAGQLRVLTDGDWQEILTGEWMIEFFAPWCPACQQLEPVWTEFAGWGDDLGVNIAKVDVTEHPGLTGRFIIMALPTIYHCKDGVFRRYQGERSKEDFLSFIEEKKWQSIEPVSSWFGPSSFLMNTMSILFKLSVFIRHCHNYLREKLGVSDWESYGIFAFAIIVAGLFLGLVMVIVADFVFPWRRFSPYHHHKKLPARRVCCRHLSEYEQEADGEEGDDEYEYGEATEAIHQLDPTDPIVLSRKRHVRLTD